MSDTPYPLPNSTNNELPSDADIVIIGAGYAGASIAHHLLEKRASVAAAQSIVILEAREACSGATGRNGGHLKPDPYDRAAKALELAGLEAAEEVTAFEVRHIKAIADLVKQYDIDCDFVVTRSTDVCLYEGGAANQKKKLDKLAAAGFSGLADVFYSDERTAERVSGIKGAKSCISATTGHLYPYKLVMHLMEQALAKGVNLQTNTPVESISEKPDGNGGWTVKTCRGSIRAPTVVYATNGYTSTLLPELCEKLIPVRGICSRIVTSKSYAPFLPTSSVLRFNDYEYDYLIQRSADGSIIVGGARRDFYTELSAWFNVWDDSKLIESAKHYFDGYMQRLFHGWEDSNAYTDTVWTGIMGYSEDGFPYVGNVPNKNGQFICAGFSGHGMPQAFLSAKAVASMIADGTSLQDADLPRLYRSTADRFELRREHVAITAYNAVMQELGVKT